MRRQCERRRDPLAALARSGLERDVAFSVLGAAEDLRRDFSGAAPPTGEGNTIGAASRSMKS
jgi:hypothetical protein